MAEGMQDGERGSRPFNAVVKSTRPVELGFCPVRSSIMCRHGRVRGSQPVACPPCLVRDRETRMVREKRAKR
jgi:hypothetical protein